MSILDRIKHHNSEKLMVITLFGLGLLLRVIIAIFFSSGQIHPDEIFQSREIAHSWLYPDIPAIVPWEFQTPQNPGEDGAARSIIFPFIMYLIMAACEILNLNYWSGTLIVLRIFMALNSALLIPAVYYFTKKLFKDDKVNIALLSTFIVSFYYIFIFFGVRSVTNSFYVPYMIFAFYFYLRYRENAELSEDNNNTKKNSVNALLSGILMGFCFAIRPDSLVFEGMFFLIYFNIKDKKEWVYFIWTSIGFLIVLFIQGITDLIYYGKFLASPINWFTFNILEGKSSIFGVSPGSYYFFELTNRVFLLFTLFLASTFIIILVKNSLTKYFQFSDKEGYLLSNVLSLSLWSIGSILVFSIPGHKEFRFIFGAFPSYVILTAFLLINAGKEIFNFSAEKIENIVLKCNNKFKISLNQVLITKMFSMLLIIIILLSIISLSYQDGNFEDWDRLGDVSHAVEWVGQQENSTGVAIFVVWFVSGGYSALHKNITVYFYGEIEGSYNWRADSTVNYLVCPKYQYYFYEDAVDTFNLYGFYKIKEVDGKTDIYYKM